MNHSRKTDHALVPVAERAVSSPAGNLDRCGSASGDIRAYFSPVLNEIAEAAGFEAALKIAAARGGTHIHIPKRAPDGHWLVLLIGREATDQLCAHYRSTMSGGSYILVPLGPKAFYAQARHWALSVRGKQSASAVALHLGVSIRVVRKWWAQKADDRQGDLF